MQVICDENIDIAGNAAVPNLVIVGASSHLPVHIYNVLDCTRRCPSTFLPVCGSNGQTYSNECNLRCHDDDDGVGVGVGVGVGCSISLQVNYHSDPGDVDNWLRSYLPIVESGGLDVFVEDVFNLRINFHE